MAAETDWDAAAFDAWTQKLFDEATRLYGQYVMKIDTSLDPKTGRPEDLRAIGSSWEKFSGHPPENPTRQFRSVYSVTRHDPTDTEGVYREVIERTGFEEIQAA